MTDVVEDVPLTVEQTDEPETRYGRSYLMADIGSSTTTVALFDFVQGKYRLLSRSATMTTAGPPWFDVSHGLQQAINQISDATGRLLSNEQGSLLRPRRANGNGIDEFGVVVSAGPPLRVLVAGLLEEVSIRSARNVLESLYAEEVDCFHVADSRGRPAQVMALLKSEPDIILLVGGTDGGADIQLEDLLETLAMAINLMDESGRPAIVFAGNIELREKVRKSLGELTDIYYTDNVRP
ncbi:MAG: glutamate mutase L, partial [Chloroflexota bacterium]